MTFTRCTLVLGTLALAGSLLGGCVNQDSYDKLLETNRALTARNAELMEQNATFQRDVENLRRQLSNDNLTAAERAKLLAELQAKLDERNAQLGSMDEKLRNMKFGPLDAATDQALADLAARNPNLLTYDSAYGMLRFNADVTFASGSYDLTPAALQAIGELAAILKASEASKYDVQVVGNTDTQPVSGNKGRPYRDNDELSLYRGLSVRKALVSDGIPGYKVMAGGFGADRPAVENSASGNTPQNRRVEVYLTKSTFGGLMAKPPTARPAARSAAPTGTTTTAPKPVPSKPVDEIIK